MGLRTMRSVVAIVGATVLTTGLAACGRGDGGGGGASGAGKTLNVLIGAKLLYLLFQRYLVGGLDGRRRQVMP
jgi:hypothetical protein